MNSKITFDRFFVSITSDYQLFDVYNPSYKRHGKLNITEIERSSNIGSEFHSQSKFEERRNFGGLTFHSVITVNVIDLTIIFLLAKMFFL